MATTTIAHLSDVHLGPIRGFTPRYWSVKRATGFFNWQRGRRFVHLRRVSDRIASDILLNAPDHVAVTGDLANIGLPAEYEVGLEWLAALGTPARVSLVPGNHDVYCPRLHGVSCFESWGTYMRSDDWGREMGGSAEALFPYVRRVGGVALVGVNSAVTTRPFLASGRVGPRQLDALETILPRLAETGLVRVVLIHHPPLPGQAPARRALEDAAPFAALLARCGADLVLHGHNHCDSLAWTQGPTGSIAVIGVATASANAAKDREPLAGYNLIAISGEGGAASIEVVKRGLAVPDGPIVEIRRSKLVAPVRVGVSG